MELLVKLKCPTAQYYLISDANHFTLGIPLCYPEFGIT